MIESVLGNLFGAVAAAAATGALVEGYRTRRLSEKNNSVLTGDETRPGVLARVEHNEEQIERNRTRIQEEMNRAD